MVQHLIKNDGFSVIKQWGSAIFKAERWEQISDPTGILAAGTGGDSPQLPGFSASSNYCKKHHEDEKVTFGLALDLSSSFQPVRLNRVTQITERND